MGNTLRVRPMGNSETNGQHFFEKLVCCPLVSPTVYILKQKTTPKFNQKTPKPSIFKKITDFGELD